MISQDELKKIVDYDPKTGKLTRIDMNGREMGGSINFYGRRIVMVGGWRGWAAKLAWYWMTGKMPEVINVSSRVDHDWSNFKWDLMRDENGVTLKRIVEKEKERGKIRVQGNGRTDRKTVRHSRHPKKHHKGIGRSKKSPAESDHRRGAGDNR